MTWQLPAFCSGTDPVQGDEQHLTSNNSPAVAGEFQGQDVCPSTQYAYVAGHSKPQQKVSSYSKLEAKSSGLHRGKD